MRTFKSLIPPDLAGISDAEVYGEEPIVDVQESKECIVVSYTFPGFYISEESQDVDGEEVTFTEVNIASTGFLAESGGPLLPSFGRYVQIPFHCTYTYTVQKSEPIVLDDLLILPAQEHVIDSPGQEHVFEYDRELYAQDRLYPEEVVRVKGPFDIDDYAALLVHVTPFQYNPAQRKLFGYGSIQIRFEFKPQEGLEGEFAPVTDATLNREAFGNLFLNPRRGITERLDVELGSVFWRPFRPSGPEFLILYHEMFKAPAERLALWKNMRGLRTETLCIDDVGSTVDEIKQEIRRRRAGRSRLRYVLLFGDVDMIPAYDTSAEPWGWGPPPAFWGRNITDYYYSTARDPTDKADYVLPWLSIGRIPVRTAQEGMAVVEQIVSYERKPPRESSYYETMTFAAYFQDGNQDGVAERAYMKTMEGIREHMVTQGFDVQRVYVTDSPTVGFYRDGTPIPPSVSGAMVDLNTATQMLVDATREGRLIIGHRDHGMPDGWFHPSFQKAHLEQAGGDVPTMFYSVNCLTGQFDLHAPTESFAETILRMEGGAPSLIAATRVSHTWLNDDLMQALFDAMWGGVLPTFPGATASYPVRRNRLGDILNYAKTYLPVVMHGSGEYIKDHFEIYHIVGDPTLEVWRTKPRRIRLYARIRGFSLSIKLFPCPQDSVITVWNGKHLIKRIEPSSTYLEIALRGVVEPPWPPKHPTKHNLTVCFWAPGYRFRRAKAKVVGKGTQPGL